MARKKVISVALAAMMTISSVWGNSADLYQSILANAKETTQAQEGEIVSEASQVNANEYGLVENIQDGTILHCFDWKYNDIKAELPAIAEAGFTSVQTSPAQKGDGDIWYWLYQPQTFSIQSNALGSKSELQALCDEAEKYGINVIVDVVANHTRGIGDDGLGGDCYHYDEGNIDYGPNSSRYDYTHKRIGMPDLNSESATVQNKVKGYVQELKSVGVDGIRWDAAKHIGLPSESCNFWPAVTGEGLYNYGEILNGPLNGYGNNDALMKEYTDYISVTDDEYGDGVLNAINGGGVPSSIGNYSERGVSKDKLVYWAESHDTYSNNGEYGKATQNIAQNKIDRAYAIVAAQGKATSLYFSRPFSTNKQTIMAGAKGSTNFTSKEVAAVNHLHNACVGEKDYYKQENGVAAVCRESGAVIVKGSGSGQVSITNGGGTTAPGTYTDEVSGSTWTVTESTISGSIGESGIAVIYSGKKNVSVSASKDSGNFTEAFELTLTPSNATKATYSINDGEAVEFTKATKVTIGEGAQIGDKITVKVTAEGEEGDPFSKTFTYTMIDTPTVPEAKAYVRVNKSDFSTAPKAYVYYTSGGKTVEPNGEFPGKAMVEEGDYYSYYTNDVDKFSVIFFYDGTQDPAANEPGYDVTGYMEYAKGSGVKAFTPATPKPATKEPEVTNTPEPIVTEEPTEPPVTTPPTETPTTTPEVTTPPTEAPTNAPWVSVSVANGTSFTDETLDVTLNLNGATEGTYSVDNGPEKIFKSGDKVTLGQGKIADSDVTLKVSAKVGNAKKTNTFTYKKVFDASKAVVKTSAVKKLQSIFEVVAEATQNNGTPASDNYATNPSGNVGSKKTITSASDFTEDMIIAQGVANDDPTADKIPEITATETPTADKTPEVTVTKEPKETIAPSVVPPTSSDIYTVNFGADRSSPQYDSIALTLKAIGYGSKDYKYEFSVDGIVVQEASVKDTYSWKGTAGTHTIKVVVTDAEGKKVTSEKTYVLDQDTSVTPTVEPTKVPDVNEQQPTVTPVITATPVVTKEPVVTEVPVETPDPNPMTATIKVGYAPPRKAGTKIPLTVTAKGGTAPYTYEIRVANSAGKSILLLSSKTKNTIKWTPSKAGTYKITATVVDDLGRRATKSKNYVVSNPITVKTFKASKYTVKKGKKIKITSKATSSDTVKYMIRLKKVGAKKYTTIRKYSKTGTFNWKANKKKGKYYIYLTVKDVDGHTKTVKMKKKLTIK